MIFGLDSVVAFAGGWLWGVFSLIAYGAYRALRSPGWDSSNIMNFLRLLTHVFLHPGDFARMHYVTPAQIKSIHQLLPGVASAIFNNRPFWYLNQDELKEVVKTRP